MDTSIKRKNDNGSHLLSNSKLKFPEEHPQTQIISEVVANRFIDLADRFDAKRLKYVDPEEAFKDILWKYHKLTYFLDFRYRGGHFQY
ncbi:hypothetical protein PRIPAC_84806 [Pristionchus pacificus]|uniref:Uncharacterized protein n=1 Tax=Pristionchus pacificus TaxID=54126 RepID=A0A2A6BMB5_PRIPA|nr:hypothetical protein PRIPAC_84806 [Pristionchus pacificus]|eukprot:PDM67064.1 hypothetical protein PRIPAC_48481 [Pristionchus pacificus]